MFVILPALSFWSPCPWPPALSGPVPLFPFLLSFMALSAYYPWASSPVPPTPLPLLPMIVSVYTPGRALAPGKVPAPHDDPDLVTLHPPWSSSSALLV